MLDNNIVERLLESIDTSETRYVMHEMYSKDKSISFFFPFFVCLNQLILRRLFYFFPRDRGGIDPAVTARAAQPVRHTGCYRIGSNQPGTVYSIQK
jgi:hypothetical protein